jgi:integrase
MYEEVAVQEGYLNKDSVPTLKSVKLAKDKKHRRDDLTVDEWKELERSARLYWSEGRTRWNEQGEINKNASGKNVLRETLGSSERAKNQKTHRKMLYLAMRISMETGIRIGSLRKVKWGHIRKNNALSSTDQKTWILIDVPAENTKTGRRYTINAPIARHLEELRKTTKYKGRDDLLFTNQKTGEGFSERIWKDCLCEMLVEAGLATWAEGDSNNLRKIEIHSGKNITWYSFRHTYITFQLTLNETPVAIVAAQCDTSIKYIEEHYFHYRAELSTQTLAKGRNTLKAATGSMEWLQIRPVEKQA